MKILLTGATGNIGQAIQNAWPKSQMGDLLLATRKTPKSKQERYFDFENLDKSAEALNEIDTLFLLRPPQLADVPKYFEPLISLLKKCNVGHVVFLSVQGAEKTPYIPHAKIEKLLKQSDCKYTFLRPSYFMQNLTTTLLNDIRKNKEIFLPSGKAKFLWIDAEDIGKCAASILIKPAKHVNKAYTLTGKDLLNFYEVADLLSAQLNEKVIFSNPNLIKFWLKKRKAGTPAPFVFVMIMLHFLPRFQSTPEITETVKELTGNAPKSLSLFIAENETILKGSLL